MFFPYYCLTNYVAVEDNYKERQEVFSKKIKAGKRRTYFFDVRATKGNDYYLIITESKKRFDSDQYERHKVFLYKEDFNKFIKALEETIDYVKNELLPDYDFDSFEHNDNDENSYQSSDNAYSASKTPIAEEKESIEVEENPIDTTPAADTAYTEEKKPLEDDTW